MVEGLLENIGLKEPRADEKKLREGFFRLWLEVRPPRQEHEFLSRKTPLERSSQAFELLFLDLIDGLKKVADHVEFVIDDFPLETMSQKLFLKAGHMSTTAGVTFWARSLPNQLQKVVRSLLFVAFHEMKKFLPLGAQIKVQ